MQRLATIYHTGSLIGDVNSSFNVHIYARCCLAAMMWGKH